MIIIYSSGNIHAQANNRPLPHPPRSLRLKSLKKLRQLAPHSRIHKALPLANIRHHSRRLFLGPHAREVDR